MRGVETVSLSRHSAGLKTRGKISKHLIKHWRLYALLVLPISYFIIFQYIPMFGVLLAFKDYKITQGIFGSPWNGFTNFMNFFESPNFWTLLKNTIMLNLYALVFNFPAPIILALALNELRNGAFKKWVQMVTYAPYFISTVVMVGMIYQFLSPRYGLVTEVVQAFGGQAQNLMGESSLFRLIYVFSDVWQGTGYAAVIYLAALSSVDPTLYEAAKIDGASKFQKMMYIDIPGIMPTIIIILILNMGGLFNVGFEKVFLMQNPLNINVSEVIQTFVYKSGLINGDYSFATAVGVFNSVMNFTILIIANQIARRTSESSLW